MPCMLLKVIVLVTFFELAECSNEGFIYSGFSSSNLSLDGIASITSDGLLRLTNSTRQKKGHAFFPSPLPFRRAASSADTFSFSTTFVFAILSEFPDLSGHGIAFVVAPSKDMSSALPSQYLGLFNAGNNGNSSNHVLAIELDTIQSSEFDDIDDNHVGIDVNSLRSNLSHTAGYYNNASSNAFQNLTLISGQPMQVWIDYDGRLKQLNVTLGPVEVPKPNLPLLSSTIDLSSILPEYKDSMFVGFSSSTGSVLTSHYILGWSFKINGNPPKLDFSKLPLIPNITSTYKDSSSSKTLWIALPLAGSILVLLLVSAIIFVVRRRMKYAELLEDWELEHGPHRFSYKDLFRATKGFKDKELLGVGGFGRVYRGELPGSKMEIAVKRVSHESRQGMREFVAEIVSMGRLRHRNLVQLLGYCRRKGELLLVYDYMPNGSLDKFLYDQTKQGLNWAQRFQIIKGVASGLLYLHEEWEQVVIHRDIKASNVLLDADMNGRLGDFGLARLYDHGTDPQTTHVVGTMGYLAPELARIGKATTTTDVFAFGAFVLEVACGRRPIEPGAAVDEVVLVDWVLEQWRRGAILEARDSRMGENYVESQLELVLKLGLLCSHPLPASRPSMRAVMHYMDGDVVMPEVSLSYSSFGILAMLQSEGLDDYAVSYPSSVIAAAAISGGR